MTIVDAEFVFVDIRGFIDLSLRLLLREKLLNQCVVASKFVLQEVLHTLVRELSHLKI